MRNPDLNETGNNRDTQPLGTHDPMYVSDREVEVKLIGIMEPYLLVLGIAIVVFICLYIYMRFIEGT